MQLGAFSISLAVKDIAVSRSFYEKIGFEALVGDGASWQILKNGDTVIGLFQGMFEKNMLTFNPRWDQACNTVEGAPDLRARLISQGVGLKQDTTQERPEGPEGPASSVVVDPDGNPILFDQHV